MRVKFTKGEWLARSLAIVYKGKEYEFGKSDTLYLDIDENDKRIYVKNPEKSTVMYFPDFTALIAGDCINTEIACDYSFEITTDENCEVAISANKRKLKGNIEFKSLYARSETADITNDNFYPKSLKKMNKKHRRRCWYLLSGLPVYVVIIILSLIIKEQLLYCCIPMFLIFTISSIAERAKYKKHVKEENIRQLLRENAVGFRTQEDYAETLKTRSEKAMERLLNKLFKK